MWKALVHLRSHALHPPIHAGPRWRNWARLTQEIPLALEVHPVALTAPIARSLLRIANIWWTTKLRMWPGPPRQGEGASGQCEARTLSNSPQPWS
jgi:hypothetical protein